jgi:hypothetical protein
MSDDPEIFTNGRYCSGRCGHLHYGTERGGTTRCLKYQLTLVIDTPENADHADDGFVKRCRACIRDLKPQ